MKSISQYGEALIALSKFVEKLDESVRGEAFKFLLTKETFPVTGEVNKPDPPSDLREQRFRAVAPQELIRRSSATSFNEKAIFLAYWLEEYQKRPTFSSLDLKDAFGHAREKAPRNMSDVVAQLEKTAQIIKAEKVAGIQHYRITNTAISKIEEELNSEKDGKKSKN